LVAITGRPAVGTGVFVLKGLGVTLGAAIEIIGGGSVAVGIMSAATGVVGRAAGTAAAVPGVDSAWAVRQPARGMISRIRGMARPNILL
jgi:hypothetical protein